MPRASASPTYVSSGPSPDSNCRVTPAHMTSGRIVVKGDAGHLPRPPPFECAFEPPIATDREAVIPGALAGLRTAVLAYPPRPPPRMAWPAAPARSWTTAVTRRSVPGWTATTACASGRCRPGPPWGRPDQQRQGDDAPRRVRGRAAPGRPSHGRRHPAGRSGRVSNCGGRRPPGRAALTGRSGCRPGRRSASRLRQPAARPPPGPCVRRCRRPYYLWLRRLCSRDGMGRLAWRCGSNWGQSAGPGRGPPRRRGGRVEGWSRGRWWRRARAEILDANLGCPCASRRTRRRLTINNATPSGCGRPAGQS
jgi:hypothetical protein